MYCCQYSDKSALLKPKVHWCDYIKQVILANVRAQQYLDMKSWLVLCSLVNQIINWAENSFTLEVPGITT